MYIEVGEFIDGRDIILVLMELTNILHAVYFVITYLLFAV